MASLVILATLSFLLLKLLPGGPFDESTAVNSVVRESLTRQWGLHEPLWRQIAHYVTSALQGDFGVSMIHPDQKVFDIIRQGMANTLVLNSVALIVVVFGAGILALLSLRFQNTLIETVIDQAMIAMVSLPSLFWGPLLIYFFGFYFNLLPVALLSSPSHYILPVLTLCFRPLAVLVRVLKTSLLENMRLDYVRTAKAKGLSPWGVLFGHVLRNSLVPFMSYSGPLVTSLLSGSFLVEMLFAIPGMGSQFIAALNDRDYTLIIGLTLFYGALLIAINLLMDVLMRAADPRLREAT